MATHGFLRQLDPSELASEVKKISWLRFIQLANLIHLPGKLAGVFDSRTFRLVAVNLIHPPDKLAGVVYSIPLNSYRNPQKSKT